MDTLKEHVHSRNSSGPGSGEMCDAPSPANVLIYLCLYGNVRASEQGIRRRVDGRE